MTNTLTFQRVHKSIVDLEQVNLPNFVVLTGLNGSGKTHLLTAIKEGKVSTSLTMNWEHEVRLFDWLSIIPQDTGIFDPANFQMQKTGWFQNIKSHRDALFPQFQQNIIAIGVPAKFCSSIEAINSLTIERLQDILPNPENSSHVRAQIDNALRGLGSHIHSQVTHLFDDQWRKGISNLHNRDPARFMTSTYHDFYSEDELRWGVVDPFQQAFGRLFSEYRELIHENIFLREYPNTKRPHLSPEEFEENFGKAPWIFVNRILEECALNFRVNYPPIHEKGFYEPKLTKITTGIEMNFHDLSSGEKVLMSFALCLYNSRDHRQKKTFPKLLLLDEIDAPLHPSMVKSLLKTIQNVLVRDNNVAVILSTHSPSTVALAPEDSIYVMNPAGPRVEKTIKNSALSLLTDGVPTFSVSFEGRRQVFVESRSDADLYDKLYQHYKATLGSERSLAFIEIGKQDPAGEKNSGCAHLIYLLKNLTDGGNQSVLGLVDWDNKNVASGRLHVLSPVIRDGIESLLFDPLLIFTLVVKTAPNFAKEHKLISTDESYVTLGGWDTSRWQDAVNFIQDMIIGKAAPDCEFVNIDYLCGISLRIRTDYVHCDDHALEEKIINIFGFLKPHNKRAGGLMNYVIDQVLFDYANFLPCDLINTFQDLLNHDINS